jgi:hypothetical protein
MNRKNYQAPSIRVVERWIKGRFSDPFPSLLGLLIRKQSQILFDDILL